MSSRLDWAELFLSSTGRLGRALFVPALLLLIVVDNVYALFLSRRAPGVVGLAVDSALLFSAACLLSKRLHDRGRAGWWAGLVLIAWAAMWPRPQHVFDWVFAPVLIWAVADLVFGPGRAGANRFGPAPDAA